MPQYNKNPPLLESNVLADPLAQLVIWLDDAATAGLIEPTAMTLATIGENGAPSARVVLFKGFRDGGLTFFTNYESRKGRELERNPHVAAVFWWDKLEREVRVEGSVAKLPRELTEKYFQLRPRESQLGALSSHQSQVVATRELLDGRLEANQRRYEGLPIPCPPNWGGYRIEPSLIEFWQGRRGRMHDRLQYRRDGSGWIIERLEP